MGTARQYHSNGIIGRSLAAHAGGRANVERVVTAEEKLQPLAAHAGGRLWRFPPQRPRSQREGRAAL